MNTANSDQIITDNLVSKNIELQLTSLEHIQQKLQIFSIINESYIISLISKILELYSEKTFVSIIDLIDRCMNTKKKI